MRGFTREEWQGQSCRVFIGYDQSIESEKCLEIWNIDTDRINDLRAFRIFVDEKLSNGDADLTLDDALVQWEYENQTDAERQATLAAGARGDRECRSRSSQAI